MDVHAEPLNPASVDELGRDDAEPAFDLEKFLAISRALDLSGISFEEAAKHPVHPSEVRVLRYMQDTELFTVHYMKALLETCAIADEEARAFLVNWAYEECYHGRALSKFLVATGHAASRRSIDEFARPRRFREILQDAGGRLLSQISEDFLAVQMSWGAINELTACHAYASMAEQTENPVLAQILRRIIKDERRHFAFYYKQATRRLCNPLAIRMAKFALNALWEPVGGTMNPEHSDFVSAYLFGNAEGQRRLAEIDRTIARLPGLGWFDLVTKQVTAGISRAEAKGERWQRTPTA